jgi:hypothetical protein
VENWFQAFAFKCNLYRYYVDEGELEDAVSELPDMPDMSNGTPNFGGTAPPEPRSMVSGRISFVGYFRDHKGQPLSKERIFSSSGESHGVSRSIGRVGGTFHHVILQSKHHVTLQSQSTG